MGINWKGVLTGGMVATVVIFLLEIPLGFLVGEQATARFEELGLSVRGNLVTSAISSLVSGFVCVWLYSAIRPRFGPGVKTAVVAGLAVWFLAVLGPSIGFVVWGLLTTGTMGTIVIWQLVEIPLATTVGAWLYKEETSRSEPGSARESRRKSSALCRSSSALSSSVKNSLPTNCAGRWSGVW